MRNSFFRPKRSVSCPKTRAPIHAPATYHPPASPTSAAVMPRPPSAGFIMRASDIEPTIVTSRPSRIHTVPRPITISQCQRTQGSLSIRAGMSVSIRPVSTEATTTLPSLIQTPLARGRPVLPPRGRSSTPTWARTCLSDESPRQGRLGADLEQPIVGGLREAVVGPAVAVAGGEPDRPAGRRHDRPQPAEPALEERLRP